MKVTVILDPAYGLSNDEIPTPAYWIVDSSVNRALAGRMHRRSAANPNSAVFDGSLFMSLTDAALGIFPSVAEHHGCWTEMEFIGVGLNDQITASLAGEGVRLAPTQAGFIATSEPGCQTPPWRCA